MDKLNLVFQSPANDFSEAFLIGNGEMGAVIYGTLPQGRIPINFDRLWSGTGEVKEKKIDSCILRKAREYIFGEEFQKGEEYIEKNMLGEFSEAYMPLGDLNYDIYNYKEYNHYERRLNLSTAEVEVDCTNNSERLRFTAFASYPGKCIAFQWKSEIEKFGIRLYFSSKLKYTNEASRNQLIIQGNAPSHVYAKFYQKENPVVYDRDKPGMSFLCQAEIKSTDGNIKVKGDCLEIEDATYVNIIVIAEVGYQNFRQSLLSVAELKDLVKSKNQKQKKMSMELLRDEHVKDYKKLFERLEISLPDNDEYVLYYQFCRYLMIASSRENTQAANLQGIWNEAITPPWNCNYTTNINLQMNYWGTIGANLRECFLPLIDIVEQLAQAGRETAKNIFQCRGWCLFHNTDIWRKTDMTGGVPRFAFWPLAGVWLSTQIYEYYRYTEDIEILENRIYPIMKGATEFCLDFLVEDKDKILQTCPSTSPENAFLLNGNEQLSVAWSSAMDIQLVKDLFTKTIEAASILKDKSDYLKDVFVALEKLPPIAINDEGCIQEWCKDFKEAESGHRHFSHLVGLYPCDSLDYNKDYIQEACIKSIKKRIDNGGGSTGWSLVWLVCFWAKLRDSDKVEKYLKKLLKKSTFKNLLDFHPPIPGILEGEPIFQIDGNLGSISVFNLIFAQGDGANIWILPALPPMWKKGFIKGLRLYGNISLDLFWENSKVYKINIKGKKGKRLFIYGITPSALGQTVMITKETKDGVEIQL